MKNIEFLVGSLPINNCPLKPYSDMVCNFAAQLSQNLLKNSNTKAYSDVLSFAFWCRKGNVKLLQQQWTGSDESRVGKGLVFHIAPSNVPVNFAFSYMFSLFAGNANIVRVPSKDFPQVRIIITAIKEVLNDFPEIMSRTAFVRYPVNDDITQELSNMADARMIWGGDSTVKSVRSLDVKPRCIDVVFADRYSFSIIDGVAVHEANEKQMMSLARGFYNDTYLMDQNACSSPQIIFWQNAQDADKEKFWQAIYDYAEKNYVLQPASAVDKYDKACSDAISLTNISKVIRYGNLLYRVIVNSYENIKECKLRGSCGYFYETDLQNFVDLKAIVTEKYQTITYYGINANELCDFVKEQGLRGIDRIVPIGDAMDIGVIWDGYDIVRMLSRIVYAK
ncbi:MAG: acyl-CoA reductase [Christensenella sp.]